MTATTTIISTPFDDTRAEAFAARMGDTLNHAAVALMASIGHRTRLFDTMAAMSPAGSVRIAERAGLDERYVREWLGAMVAGEIVTYDEHRDTYWLPEEHAAALTRASGGDNIASAAQFIPLLGSVEDRIVDCFRHGGGVPYEAYGRFHEIMAEESAQTVVAALDDHILPLIPDVVECLERGIDVLDVGCGVGRALQFLARRFPSSRFVGYDLSKEAVAAGRQEAADKDLANLRFESRDATAFPDGIQFDLVLAFDAIHDQIRPARVLENIRASLRPGGTFLMQDIQACSHVHGNIGHPLGPFLYTISCLHCMTVSLANGGAGLGAMWGEELALTMLGDAGFNDVTVSQLAHDEMNSYYVARV